MCQTRTLAAPEAVATVAIYRPASARVQFPRGSRKGLLAEALAPRYSSQIWEWRYLLFVVGAFAAVSTGYWFDGLLVLSGINVMSGLMHRSKTRAYSITSSARSRNASDIVRFSAFAVLRLTANSNFSADCSGSSPGFAPFRILST